MARGEVCYSKTVGDCHVIPNVFLIGCSNSTLNYQGQIEILDLEEKLALEKDEKKRFGMKMKLSKCKHDLKVMKKKISEGKSRQNSDYFNVKDEIRQRVIEVFAYKRCTFKGSELLGRANISYESTIVALFELTFEFLKNKTADEFTQISPPSVRKYLVDILLQLRGSLSDHMCDISYDVDIDSLLERFATGSAFSRNGNLLPWDFKKFKHSHRSFRSPRIPGNDLKIT